MTNLTFRSYQSCPSRGSNHSSSNEDVHPASAEIGIQDRISEENERIDLDRAHSDVDAPMDYSRQDGTKSNDKKDKRETMSILGKSIFSCVPYGLLSFLQSYLFSVLLLFCYILSLFYFELKLFIVF
jgi:hypothetical protein